MLPIDADPALLEAEQLYAESRRVRRAIVADRERGASSEELRRHEENLDQLESRLAAVLSDDAVRAEAERALAHRAAVLRLAVWAFSAEQRQAELVREANHLADRAAASGRSMTAAESQRRQELRTLAEQNDDTDLVKVTSEEDRDSVLEAISRMRLKVARRQLRRGLLLTEQMQQIIAEAVPTILRGDPVLLIGETGGAKTALAEHISRVEAGVEPEFVSGYGDITVAQVIGAHELRADDGATTSVFVDGPLLRAMQDGRPLILDELNAMPAEFLKRLNRVLQLRPGDIFDVQEDAQRRIEIAPGFAIIATANEQTPHRYRGLDRLSAELINRFGASTYRVHYPDSGVRYTESPAENALLATAAAVDQHGELPRSLSANEILRLARAAFISQQVFAGSRGEGFSEYVSTEREIDGRPGLEETVLAPRTMVGIIGKVAGSGGAMSLDHALARFVEGIMHREDRRVIALILSGQGFSLEVPRRS